jgi:hypothetical protein
MKRILHLIRALNAKGRKSPIRAKIASGATREEAIGEAEQTIDRLLKILDADIPS